MATRRIPSLFASPAVFAGLALALPLLAATPSWSAPDAGTPPAGASDAAAQPGGVMDAAATPATPAALRARIKAAVEELDRQGRAVNRAYAPVRRGAPADPGGWEILDELHAAVGEVARTAMRLDAAVARLGQTEDFSPRVRRSVFRERQARADSLAAAAATIAARPWRPLLPEDPEEARLAVHRLARQAKLHAEQAVAASDDLAYAVGVTEGVGPRSLSLSLVGILVVFTVLALIALLVGLIRRLDDGWQEREEQSASAALEKDPTIDETTAVLIAAACATVITGRHRVRRIRRLLSPRTKRTPWSAQGRLILQGSHAVERKHG